MVVMTPRITMKVICVVYVMNINLRNLETLMDLSLQNGINVIYVAIGPILHIVTKVVHIEVFQYENNCSQFNNQRSVDT
jgi:hypothetical protein